MRVCLTVFLISVVATIAVVPVPRDATALVMPGQTPTASPTEYFDNCCQSETSCSEPPPAGICELAPLPLGRGFPRPYECAASGRCEIPDPTPTPVPTCMSTPVCTACTHAICGPYPFDQNGCPQWCVCEGPPPAPTCSPGPICQFPGQVVCDDQCSGIQCRVCRCVIASATPTPTPPPPTPTATRTPTCAGTFPHPTCSAGDVLVCEDPRCGSGCSCATRTFTPTPATSPTPCSTPVCPGSVLPPLCVDGPCSCYCEATPAPTLSSTPTPPCVPTPLIPPYCATHCEPCPTIRAGCYAQACPQCIENPVCAPDETCVPRNPANPGCCSCATATATPPVSCVGDCDRDGVVRINELILGVSIELGGDALNACPALACSTAGSLVYINCLVVAVNNALDGCGHSTPTITPFPTPVLDCSGAPDGQDCIGPCGPCNPSVHGYCHLGECMTECAPCVSTTPTPPATPTCTPQSINTCRPDEALECSFSGCRQCACIRWTPTPTTTACTPTFAPTFEPHGGRCRTVADCPVGTVRGLHFVCLSWDDYLARDSCHQPPTVSCSFLDPRCPVNYACSVADGTCSRAACNVDDDCNRAYCVNRECNEELGVCGVYPP